MNSKKLKQIVLFCIIMTQFWSHRLFSQFNTVNYNIDELCDYSSLVDRAKSEREKIVTEELYIELLGVLEELERYRNNFIANGDYIDLFPTAYFHTTMSEMLNIVRNKNYNYPIEKMQQMKAFYEAYGVNRQNWANGKTNLVEAHWKIHFQETTEALKATKIPDCYLIGESLTSAIKAHVIYDLPRAIAYAYKNRFNVNLTSKQLLSDFNKTDGIFSVTNAKTQDDIDKAGRCGWYWQHIGNEYFNGGPFLNDKDVVKLRKEAWDLGMNGQNTSGTNISQPKLPLGYLYGIGKKTCNKEIFSTLFLFDLSGSMGDNGGGSIPKIEQAKQASKTTLNSLASNNQGVTNQVAVYGFSGGCTPDPTIEISPFTDDLISVDAKIDGMRAGGGTPLSNALRAAECKMAAHLQKEGQQKGKLIILSDGQGTCGNIRPNGVYNSAPLQKNRSVMIDASQCGGGGGGQTAVSYYTVGFNIPPGSHAERDLQYLSQISGGKYLNVQNQTQLVRAFRKFNRVYQPKPNPALSGHPSQSVQDFSKGVAKIKEEYYKDALAVYESFIKAHPDDCHGYYNLALAQEANDFFKEAIKNYQKYLSICPDAFDRAFVEKQISFLEDEFREFVLFQKEVIKSDLAFLNLHFQKIQNGQSVVLAEEFKGFLQEKDDYYEILPRLIGSEDSDLMSLAEDLTSAFQQCAQLIRKSPNSWDQDAIPIISMSYLNLEELIELL